jgi:transposase
VCQAVRKLFPAKGITKPPLSEDRRAAIRTKLREGLSHQKIAKALTASKATVWRMVHERDDRAALGRDLREPYGDEW